MLLHERQFSRLSFRQTEVHGILQRHTTRHAVRGGQELLAHHFLRTKICRRRKEQQQEKAQVRQQLLHEAVANGGCMNRTSTRSLLLSAPLAARSSARKCELAQKT
jgi:hypothetical protein